MTNKILEELFNKKTDEFMKYQKYVLNRIKELNKELLTEDVVCAYREYRREKKEDYRSDDLWLVENMDTYAVYARLNPNKNGFAISNLGARELVHNRPNTVDQLRCAVEKFKDYEKLLNLMETELPQMVANLLDWEKEYLAKDFEFLNSLNFDVSEK